MNIATNKSYKKYDYISRYEAFPYYYNTEDERYFYGLTSWLNNNVGYALYTVQPGDTYDSIAFDYYGSPTSYWVICDFNRILDSFSIPEVGTKLKLPALNGLSFEE